MPESKDLWTQFLDLISQVVTPSWNDLIPLLPFPIVLIVLLVIINMIRSWMKAGALNSSRVPAKRSPLPPEGIHLPGPSIWPFVAPVGGFLILLSLVFPGFGLPINPLLFGAGLATALIAVIGWLWDANKEWRSVEAGALGHMSEALSMGSASSGLELSAGPATLDLPEGVHLPGPSPWPFFAPIGGFFVLLGLIFGWPLIVGGIVMAIIAIVGWFRDAGHEYRGVEASGHAEPLTRDPVKAFPMSLVPVYLTIAAVAVALTLAPAFLDALPGNQPAGSSGVVESADPAPQLAADSVLAFSVDRIVVPAGQPLTMTFDNQQAGVPHNVHIVQGGQPVFEGADVTGVAQIVYDV
ncbi:MAG: hypothetical protein ABIZ34_01755, partial [Candidatus Limnocylindrales bacterium]